MELIKISDAAHIALYDGIVQEAMKAGYSEKDGNNLAMICIENAQGVDGFEISVACAIETMKMYLDDPSLYCWP